VSSKYKAEWKEYSLNVEFWTEVLVDKKITAIAFDADGIASFTLDSGEVIYLPTELKGGRLMIKD